MEQIVKIQRRNCTAFVTLPSEYAEKIAKVTHMQVWENDKGNLEYEPIVKVVKKEE